MRPYRHLATVLAALALSTRGVAQETVDRGGFVVCLGDDTLAVERYTRSATTLESEIILRVPTAKRVTYTAGLDSSGEVRTITVAMNPVVAGPLSPKPSRGTLWFRGDTAETSLTLGDSTRTIRVAARPGSMPLTAFSHALVEQAILQAGRTGKDSVEFDWVGIGAPMAYPAYVARRRDGSVMVGLFNAPAIATVDRHGRMLALDGRATTAKVEVHRVKAPDLEQFARSFAADEAAGGPVGPLSPRDTVIAMLDKATLMVDYGRPRKRGRDIFGKLVPWNKVWRTGANAATQLETDAAIVADGWTIPAGRYTLWSIPAASGATLIVSRQTGQWGTQYDPEQDLARLELTREPLAEPVEQFTIAIEPTLAGGVLRLSWDTTAYVLPFTIASP
ncbi:MAG: DUF2911 domain-containing protein [Gemmatimonadales bacterium]